MENNKYIGIDLGTTNSVISYGMINSKNKFESKVADVIVPNGNSNLSAETIIPSVVSYVPGMKDAVIVGERAKKTNTYGRVVRSVKSMMGNVDIVENLHADIEEKSPAEVSSRILKCLTQKCKIKGDKDDVIVAVPASFPPSAIKATKKAMELAGIKTEGEHPVIISEPLAVLYSLWEQKLLESIGEDVLPFDRDQNVLVFDIGGGTTDVAIFSLKKKNSVLEMLASYEQVAYSRHTPFAGDDFDIAIAEELYERAIEKIGTTPKYPEIVKSLLKEHAENIKKMYTEYVYCEYDCDEGFDISIPNLFEGYSYDDTLYMEEIENLVMPFLAKHLTIEDAKNANTLPEKDINGNIIYPILDCLYKAYQKKGNDFKITNVILNGGMTYFPLIKERLDNFFELDCINALNGDLSVAKGASFFHYCMHAYGIADNGEFEPEETQLIKNTDIINDSLSIGLDGSYISRIVNAGDSLPINSRVVSGRFYMSKKAKKLKVDIYTGEGTCKNKPCEIAYRTIFRLDKVYDEGTPVDMCFNIDEFKQLILKIYVDGNYTDEYIVETKSSGNVMANDKEAANLKSMESIKILPDNELNLLFDFRKNHPAGYKKRCMDLLARIKNASNKAEVARSVYMKIKGVKNTEDTIVGDLYNLAISYLDYFVASEKETIVKHAKSQFLKSELAGLVVQNSYVKLTAMKLIYRMDQNGAEFCKNFLSDKNYGCYAKAAADPVNEQ